MTVSLQLADRLIKYPQWVIEDVLVKVDKLYLLSNLIILDMEEDGEVPTIFGRPFLTTGNTLIDVQQVDSSYAGWWSYFPSYEALNFIKTFTTPWYADIVDYLTCGIIFHEFSYQRKKKFFFDAKYYQWEDPLLYKHYADHIIRRCILEEEMGSIFYRFHEREVSEHFGPTKTAAKVLQCGFYWPALFKDAHTFVESCKTCQWRGNISRKNEMPLNNIHEVELFDVWGIDFTGLFSPSYSNQLFLWQWIICQSG